MDCNGFSYCASKNSGPIRYFKCALRQHGGCKGSLKVAENNIITIIKEHNHLPGPSNPLRGQIDKFRKKLCDRAINETLSLHNIYSEEAANPEFQNAALEYGWLRANSTMNTARRRHNPRVPTSLVELGEMLITHHLRYQCNYNIEGYVSEQFYRSTIIADGTTVVFCSQSLADLACQGADELCIDGTFKVVPAAPSCHQLLTVHVTVENHNIPVVYALMSKRSKAAYIALLQYIKQQLLPTVYPTFIITDFEQALQTALEETYPNAQIMGCWFHYVQAVWKKMRALGYLASTTTDLNTNKAFKMLLALPLLPAENIIDGFHAVQQWCTVNGVNLDQLFAYMRRFWLNRIPIRRLSVYGTPRRTNNNVERFHRTLKSFIGEVHPNVWTFVVKLIKLNTNMLLNVIKLKRGERVTRFPPVSYATQNNHIRSAQTDYISSTIGVLRFLERAGHFTDGYNEAARVWAVNIPDEDLSDEENAIIQDIPNIIEQPAIAANHVPLEPDYEIEIDDVEHPADFHIPEDDWEPDWMDPPEVVIDYNNPWIPDGYDEAPADNLLIHEQCICCTVRKRWYMLPCGHFVCGFCARYLYNSVANLRRHCPACQNIIELQPIRAYL